MRRLTRRDALKAAPLAVLPAVAGGGPAQDPAPPGMPPRPVAAGFPGMTVRMHEPQNLEFPFSELKSWVTPTEQFYVRSHFAVPKVDPDTYRLAVEGAVEKPFTLSLADLRALPAVTAPLTLECAGNGRVFLVPQVRGLQWGLGAVGNAEWTGVPLAALLERAKVKPGAVEVVLVGADAGTVADPATPGAIHFDRSLPLGKAMRPEVILAYKQNGAYLTPSHGAPVRAVVGGWYGMASVKWLTRVVVVTKPHAGFWQTLDYAYFERPAGGVPSLTPVTEMQPKAAVARPAFNEVIPADRRYRIAGAAWAGDQPVAKVDVSTDGGATWAAATLTGAAKPYCWRLWEYDWTPARRGPARLLARATDAAGATQPARRDPDRRTYLINHLVPVEVVVK